MAVCLFVRLLSRAIFHLFCKVTQVKNCLFPSKPLSLCRTLRFVKFGREVCLAGKYLCLDMLRAADKS